VRVAGSPHSLRGGAILEQQSGNLHHLRSARPDRGIGSDSPCLTDQRWGIPPSLFLLYDAIENRERVPKALRPETNIIGTKEVESVVEQKQR